MAGTVNAKTIRAALGAARAAGLDPALLASAHGLAEPLVDIDARFSHSVWIGLWKDIVARTGNETAGLDAAERLPWGHFDVIDYLVGTSADLGQALARFARYFPLVSTGVRHVLEEHATGGVQLVRRYAPGCDTRLLPPAEFAFANVMLRTRRSLGIDWRPLEVRFASPAPPSIAARERVFGCRVTFDASESAIVIARDTLRLPMRQADPNLLQILEHHAEDLMKRSPADDGLPREREAEGESLSGKVRLEITRQLPSGQPSLARVARRLAMSERSLRRYLTAEDTSFSQILSDVRHEQARSLLRSPAISIGEIAYLLGFSNVSAFSRAFKAWCGAPPGKFRNGGR